MKKLFLLGLSLTLFFTSCSKTDDPFEKKVEIPTYENGILFLNEGNFGGSNASMGYLSYSYNTIHQNIAQPLGDVAQSMAFKGNKAFVVMNNSNKIEIFNRYTLKHEATISKNLSQPRYISFANNEIYVTNYASKSVTVFKDTDYSFVSEIQMEHEVDNIVTSNNKIYVQKSAFGNGSEIAVIDPKTKTILKTIDLKNTAPKPLTGLQGLVAYGDFVYAIASSKERSDFYKINNVKDESITHFYSTKNVEAQNLRADNNKLYYTSKNQVYAWDIDAKEVEIAPILTLNSKESQNEYGRFYGFNVIDQKIYVANAGDFIKPSKIKIYNTNGQVLKEFEGGLLTNGFYNNYKF